MMIIAKSYFAFVTLFLLTLTTAWAGNVQVDRDMVEFETGRKTYQPRSSIVLRFNTAEYFYGSQEYAYLPLIVTASNDTLDSAGVDNWLVYGVLSNAPGTSEELSNGAAPYIFRFNAPDRPGKYKVYIGSRPLFRDYPLKSGAGYKEAFVPHTFDARELVKTVLAYPSSLQEVSEFEVVGGFLPPSETAPVYLQVNGTVPSKAKFPGGILLNPIKFSWYVGKEFTGDRKSVLYRYRMEPEDEEWGAWTSADQVAYSVLLKGIHRFRVQAKHLKEDKWIESIPATMQFALNKDHITKPTRETLTKGGAVSNGSVAFNEVYKKSYALLVGVWKFDDAAGFPQFDEKRIQKDISSMEAALKGNGFEVKILSGAVNKSTVVEALDEIVELAGRDDRIFVYFSTHGFPDPLMGSEGYLATSDCVLKKPTVGCLRLNDLSVTAERALDGKQVKQVLFAIDSCFSGLGVVRKSVAVPDLTRLAVPQGAYMLTAGMADQTAAIDRDFGMSTFTHFLSSGLSGEADILGNNGMITLSELFVYVQYKVAQRTDSKQIPMLGKMRGDGEMLFNPLSGN
ncbi:caspase family protein [Pseudomonas izuensis]|uniref:caspase family protein n=1 Tax=Pseudomonas izuensis TaxID=2684212 RepID=UPI00135AA90D|nr:caspase family protein [Pseudomonas izuensis]